MDSFFITYTKKFLILLLTSLITLVIIFFVEHIAENNHFRREVFLRNQIEKYLTNIYAIDGEYPKDLSYLEQFGVVFEDDKFLYEYEYINEHKRPMITVTRKSMGLE